MCDKRNADLPVPKADRYHALFDAVKFQRKVREELSEKYSSNREAFLRELKEKYGNLQKQKAGTHIR